MLLPDDGKVKISANGLRPQGGAIVASKCGVLRQTRGGQLWIEGRQKRWVLHASRLFGLQSTLIAWLI